MPCKRSPAMGCGRAYTWPGGGCCAATPFIQGDGTPWSSHNRSLASQSPAQAIRRFYKYMEWRAILAVVLSIVVLVVWQYVFIPTREPPQRPTLPETQEKPANEPTTQAPRVTIPGRPSTPAAPETGSGRETPLQTLSERLRTANFTPSVSQLTVTAQQPSGDVRFEYQDPTGWRAVKTVALHNDSYALDVGVTLAKPGAVASPPVAGMDAERLVILENDLLRIVMTTRGARIKELFLK